jgi:pyrroline-5-carboxylate reductase
MKTNTIGFIGGGRITKIFLQALTNKQIGLSLILICDTNPDTLHALKKQFPKIHITDSCELAAKQDIIFIALHPPVIMETLEQIKTSVSEKTQVVSLAPKINIEKIASTLATKNIARMIPNATSYINEGFNPVSFSSDYAVDEKRFLIELLSILGLTFEVEEPKLEAYAIVSAMLPTYFWFQYKEMEKLGVEMGLEQKESRSTIHQTLQAALNLLYKSELTSEEVIDLIPIKPIGENESEIKEILNTKLTGLFNKIKPQQ